MSTTKLILSCAIATAIAPIALLPAQVETLVPDHVPGAKPVVVEHTKIHGAASMDVGDQDNLRFDGTKLHEILDNYAVRSSFEIYPGTHTSAVADRFQNHGMPFFSKSLCVTEGCR